MHTDLQTSHKQIPVTALAFVQFESTLLLLTGEGPWLQVYDEHTRRLLASKKLFDVENIHGLKACTHQGSADLSNSCRQILVWAGRSICLATVNNEDDTADQANAIIKIITKARADDWVQDACFPPARGQDSIYTEAVFVTSHNALFGFRRDRTSDARRNPATIELIAAGSPSLLYCAHILWPDTGRGLVAAGTVFGEVLFWSFPAFAISRRALPLPSCLHYTIKGHEGSVFGVRISEPTVVTYEEAARWFIVSCSDDRTIRVWDVTGWNEIELDESPQVNSLKYDANHPSSSTAQHVASVMGHNSRIWGVRCFGRGQDLMRILSFGEDCSAQIWRLRTPLSDNASQQLSRPLIEHQSTYAFHTGKNVWAVDIHETPHSDCLIASGGADGRIACFRLSGQGRPLADRLLSGQYPVNDVRMSIAGNCGDPGRCFQSILPLGTLGSTSRALFVGLSGDWSLVRSLKSEIPAYPTGEFIGVASFQARTPTDPAFDMEYLYIEEGHFVTEQDVQLSATRRYVYRHQQHSDQISAWFVKVEDGETVDYLFHALDCSCKNTRTVDNISLCAHHLCNEDNYWVEYIFPNPDSKQRGMGVKYTVKGPNKDYLADAKYTRDVAPKHTGKAVPEEIGSGAVVHSIDRLTSSAVPSEGLLLENDSFKSYSWIDEKSFLVTTDHGWIIVASIRARSGTQQGTDSIVSWTPVVQEPGLRYSCVVTNVARHGLVLMTGQDGTIYCFQIATMAVKALTRLPRKVACLDTSSLLPCHGSSKRSTPSKCSAAFASCVGSSTAYHLTIHQSDELPRCTQVQLSLPAAFVPTSSSFVASTMILILGSRKGSLAVYYIADTEGGPVSPELVTHYIHGGETVTAMEIIPLQNKDDISESMYILSAGRDGRYAVHLLMRHLGQQSSAKTTLQTVHCSSLPLGTNIEGTLFNRETGSLFLWGFHGKQFVVWDDTLKVAVMTVECGGAHRNWAYIPLENTHGGGNLVWTKASTLNICSQSQASHSVLQDGGHGREVKTMSVSPLMEGYDGLYCQYLATGAEDTRIRISRITVPNKSQTEDQKSLAVISKHTTGVQRLCWSPNGQLLFSVAGREEFYVWQVQPVPHFGIGITRLSECPPVSDLGDLRIMDLNILGIVAANSSATIRYILGVVYSDSSLRIFLYDSANTRKPFEMISSGQYSSYCLTQASLLRIDSCVHLCTASTDGCIGLWPLDQNHEKIGDSDEPYSNYETSLGSICVGKSLGLMEQIRIHQSSITCIATVKLLDESILIATVGDDGALAFSRINREKTRKEGSKICFTSSQGSSENLVALNHSTLLIPKAHSAAISAVQYLRVASDAAVDEESHRFVTCGKDQRLKIWRVKGDLRQPDMKGFMVIREQSTRTSLADVSSLATTASAENRGSCIIIAGVGVETVEVQAMDETPIYRSKG